MTEDFDYEESDECDRCGGDGWIAAVDGDPSDWITNTYCGDLDTFIVCRKCGGKGVLLS